jgi:hypothetical protein
MWQSNKSAEKPKAGATTFSIAALRMTTLSIMILHSQSQQNTNTKVSRNICLSVVILTVIMLDIVMLSVMAPRNPTVFNPRCDLTTFILVF